MAMPMRFAKSLLLVISLACALRAVLGAEDKDIAAFRVTTAKRGGYDWWSLQPIKEVQPPGTNDKGWVRNPIDLFILAGLKERGLAPSPQADKRTLIRRVTIDLTGLPP